VKRLSGAPLQGRLFTLPTNTETETLLCTYLEHSLIMGVKSFIILAPGVSGSIFYVTRDDNFICKTVQHKEANFLQKLLPGYYLNLQQNPRTLLPKFFGFYCYSCNAKNVRLVSMSLKLFLCHRQSGHNKLDCLYPKSLFI